MGLVKYFSANRALGFAVFVVLAGCSSNAGFGTPASGPNPVSNPNQPYGQPYGSPGPAVSGSIDPLSLRAGDSTMPTPFGSPSPTPPPAPNTVSIAGAALHLAYDGSAKDPVKAPRLLVLSFALQNTTQNSAKVASVAAYADKVSLGSSSVSLSAGAGQISEVATLALSTSDDPMKYKEIILNFLDGSKKMVGSVKLDVPPLETEFTSLDEKHPKGPFSIDSLEISPIGGGKTPHFEATFAVTNASAAAVNVTEFDIKPPKGDTTKTTLSVQVPTRSVSGFVSIVVPYNGKSLPPGTYSITALQGTSVAAKATAELL